MKSDWEELADECYKATQESGLTRERSQEILKESRTLRPSIEIQELLRIAFDESLSEFEREMKTKEWYIKIW